ALVDPDPLQSLGDRVAAADRQAASLRSADSGVDAFAADQPFGSTLVISDVGDDGPLTPSNFVSCDTQGSVPPLSVLCQPLHARARLHLHNHVAILVAVAVLEDHTNVAVGYELVTFVGVVDVRVDLVLPHELEERVLLADRLVANP